MVRQTLLQRGGLVEPAMAAAVPEWELDGEKFTPQLTFCQKARLAATAEDDVQAEQVLFKIAQMAGLPANGLADHYFQIADSISAELIAIETGTLQVPGAARAFYDPTVPNSLSGAMNTIITHWSAIAGHDVKAGKSPSGRREGRPMPAAERAVPLCRSGPDPRSEPVAS
jgi:hypothetical protein